MPGFGHELLSDFGAKLLHSLSTLDPSSWFLQSKNITALFESRRKARRCLTAPSKSASHVGMPGFEPGVSRTRIVNVAVTPHPE